MTIGIIGPAEIASRRFAPAVEDSSFKFAGVAIASKEERMQDGLLEDEFETIRNHSFEKARLLTRKHGGIVFESYESIIESLDVDAVYIPLPPALHYTWAKRALESGKHVIVEKPATTKVGDVYELVKIANKNNLALHENYMFRFHKQINELFKIIDEGEIGEARLFRIDFGFPQRDLSDFRYKKELGGGALLDAGGYVLYFAFMILGPSARISSAHMNFESGIDVDMFGVASLINDSGMNVQIAFGMDNQYKCDLDVWGSKGRLTSNRVFTAPKGFVPKAIIQNGDRIREINLPEDDAFLKSIKHFEYCIHDKSRRTAQYNSIIKQAELVRDFCEMANNKV